MCSILGTWLHRYPEDFHQPPEFPCLKMILAYLELNMPGSALEHQAHLLLVQLEHLEPTEAESDARAAEQALEALGDLAPTVAYCPLQLSKLKQAPLHIQGLCQGNVPAPAPESEPAHTLAVI